MASILRKNMYGYLFVDVIRAKQFSESEVRRKYNLRETGNVQAQIHKHIFAQMEVLASIILQMFLQLVRGKKMLPKSSPFPARDVHFSVFSSTTF